MKTVWVWSKNCSAFYSYASLLCKVWFWA